MYLTLKNEHQKACLLLFVCFVFARRGKNEGKGELGSLEWTCTHTNIKMDNQQGPPVEHMEFSSRLCGSLEGRGVWRRRDTCTCMAESLCCPPETITTMLIGHMRIKSKMLNNKINKKSQKWNVSFHWE